MSDKIVRAREGDFKPDLFFRARHEHSVRSGVPFESVMSPEYWRDVSSVLRRYDEITIVSEDNMFWARLLVTDVLERAAAVVICLEFVDLSKVSDGSTIDTLSEVKKDYVVKHAGFGRWCAVRKSDGTVISKGNETKSGAEKELDSYLKRALR